jgi:hypothetical protein
MKNTLSIILLIILGIVLNESNATSKILFLGLSGEGAPSIEKTFDASLRERLSVVSDLKLIDYIETCRFQRLIDFTRYSTVSENLVKNLQKHLPDSLIVIWGAIKHLGIKPVRRKLLNASLHGTLTVGIHIYLLNQSTFLHSGTIESSFDKSKGTVFFSSVEKVTTVSASDREEIIRGLLDNALNKTTSIIVSVLKSTRLLQPGYISATEETYRPPSISDVFTVPSVEAPEVNGTPSITEETSDESSEKQMNENNSATETK